MVKPRSDIYKHFTTLSDGRRKCNYCPEQEGHIYKKGTSTTPLWVHLKTQHGRIKKGECEPEQVPLMPAQQEALNDAFVQWIISDLQPFTTSDNPEFIKFIKLLNSNYTPPCRQTVRKTIMERYHHYKEIIKSILHDAPGMISLTSDIWTSMASDSYYGITAHFIDKDWQLQSIILDISSMPQPHTGEIIKDTLLTVATDFGIESRIFALTTDNAKNITKGVKLLTTELHSKCGRQIYSIRCGAHVLNLTVQEGLKSMFSLEEDDNGDNPSSALTNLRLCINAIRRSPRTIHQLQEICQNLNMKYYNLPNDCPTRWSSTYHMIDRAIMQKTALQVLFITSDAKYIKNALNNQEWSILEANLRTLKIFSEATKALSVYQEPSLHQVEGIYNLIKNYLEMNTADSSKSMLTKINEHLAILSEAHWKSQVLHPGYKLDKKDNCYQLKYFELKQEAEIIAGCMDNTENNAIDSQEIIQKTALQRLEELVNETIIIDNQHTTSISYNAVTEINRFLHASRAQKDDNPLTWWHAHEKEFPILAVLARSYFAIPASSVPCEQLFSVAGNTVTKNRNSLAPEAAQATLCLRSWLRFLGV